jgi:hypothetical protein
MSGAGIRRARCWLRQDFARIKPNRLRQRIHIAQWLQQAQGGLAHTTVNPRADFLKLNRQNIGTNLLVKRPRGCQRAKISMLAQPEPRSEGIVSGAEDLRTACGKRPQLSIRTRALKDERSLGLIELAGKPTHLLFAQFIGGLNHGERIARQGFVGEDIDQSGNQFGHAGSPGWPVGSLQQLLQVEAYLCACNTLHKKMRRASGSPLVKSLSTPA